MQDFFFFFLNSKFFLNGGYEVEWACVPPFSTRFPHRQGHCSDFYLQLLSREIYLNKTNKQKKQHEKQQENSHTYWMNYEPFPVRSCIWGSAGKQLP